MGDAQQDDGPCCDDDHRCTLHTVWYGDTRIHRCDCQYLWVWSRHGRSIESAALAGRRARAPCQPRAAGLAHHGHRRAARCDQGQLLLALSRSTRVRGGAAGRVGTDPHAAHHRPGGACGRRGCGEAAQPDVGHRRGRSASGSGHTIVGQHRPARAQGREKSRQEAPRLSERAHRRARMVG